MFSPAGKVGLVVGIADEQSIAWGRADAFHEAGAELVVTYTNGYSEGRVRPIVDRLGAPIVLPLDVADDEEMGGVGSYGGPQ